MHSATLIDKHERKIVACLATIFSLACALLLLRWSEAIQLEPRFIINLTSLAVLTSALAIPGLILVFHTLWHYCRTRQVTPVMIFGLVGSALAISACVAIAFAADCVPQCNGRGGLFEGLVMATPAGFAAGTACLWALRFSNKLITQLRH